MKLVSSIRRHSYLSVSSIIVERRVLSRGVDRGAGMPPPSDLGEGPAPPPGFKEKLQRGLGEGEG